MAPLRAVLPRAVAERLRPQLPSVVTEVVARIAAEVPSYGRPLEGSFGQDVRTGVEVALGRFLAPADTDEPALTGSDRKFYVALGRNELRQGRSLGALLTAYRVGARVAFRRVATLAREAGLEADALIPLAEATFTYIEELSAASIEGYAAEQAGRAGELDRHRHELLALLLADTADAAAVAEAAAAARWAVPDTIAAVLVTPQCAEGLSRRLGPEALVAAHNGAVVALVPAPETSSARTALAASVVGRRAIVGPARPSRQASVSLRLATLAARLADSGVLSADPMFVDEHLATLVVHRDPELVAELVTRRLAALEQVRDATRDRLAETLLAWLVHRGQRQPIAETLHVHPQTVGYRLTQLRTLFGEELDDPTTRFELEIALRAVRPQPTRPD